MNTCIVCESGWIIIGHKGASNGNVILVHSASVVRKWNNGRGIGGIAKAEYKDEYTLDFIGNVEIRTSKILFEIPCEW